MKRITALLMAFAILSMGTASAFGTTAQNYPSQNINMIIPFSAGGGTDTLMRKVASEFEQATGATVVILNQPGNYGALGLTNLSKSSADGYTICGSSVYDVLGSTMLGGESVQVTWEDFSYICGVNVDAEVVIAGPQSNIKSFTELVEYTRKNPGKLVVSTSGITHNILLGILNDKLGVKVTNIAYSGGGESLNALLGNHVDVAIIGKSFARQVGSEYKVLCTLSPKRLPSMPDIPCVSELYPEVQLPISTRIVMAPKNVPREILNKLEDSLHKATDTEEFRTYLEKTGDYYQFTGSAELCEMIGNTAVVLKNAIANNPEAFSQK